MAKSAVTISLKQAHGAGILVGDRQVDGAVSEEIARDHRGRAQPGPHDDRRQNIECALPEFSSIES